MLKQRFGTGLSQTMGDGWVYGDSGGGYIILFKTGTSFALIFVLFLTLIFMVGCEKKGLADPEINMNEKLAAAEDEEIDPEISMSENLATAVDEEIDPEINRSGYLAAIYQNDSFLAAGTDGRLDRIYEDGRIKGIETSTLNTFTGIYTDENITLVCGANGMLLYSTDGQNFAEAETDVKTSIFGIARFQNMYLAGTCGGIILTSEDGINWKSSKTDVQNDIISVSANDDMVMAITAQTDILSSVDGVNWKIENFNEAYEGYYEPYFFTGLRAVGTAFFIIGQEKEKGSPLIMFSDTGNVWMQKDLMIINDTAYETENDPLKIYAIDNDFDQIMAVCDKGRLLTVTDCVKCNQVEELGDTESYTISTGKNKLLIAGENFKFTLIDTTQVRQYGIKAEQAAADLQNGAVIIDVRTLDEYNEGHVAGCLHIPVDEISERLPMMVPDTETEIIFYCAVGKRAQTALETAVSMGYNRIYNMGGLDDWPYDLEK